MMQKIIAFHQDELKDRVADLICGHTQHVRHQPPFQNRILVISESANRVILQRQAEHFWLAIIRYRYKLY